MNPSAESALVVTSAFPYPPDGGDKLSARAFVEAFCCLGYQTDVLCFGNPPATNVSGTPISRRLEITKPPKVRVGNAIRSLCLRRSWLFDRYRLDGRGITKAASLTNIAPYSCAVVLHPYLMPLLDALQAARPKKLIISAEVLESIALHRKARLDRGIRSSLLSREANLAANEEIAALARADCAFFYSRAELEWYRSRGGVNGDHLLFGIDLDRYQLQPRREQIVHQIAFYGTFSWHPNADGLKYLLEEVWPAIISVRQDVELTVAGRSIPKWARAYDGNTIRILGEVSSIPEFVSAADLVIVPVRIGGGTRVKTLEAMALGRPVISTTASLEGNDALVGEEILVADTPAEFANQIDEILSNSDKWERIATAARRYVSSCHDYRTTTVRALKRVGISHRDPVHESQAQGSKRSTDSLS